MCDLCSNSLKLDHASIKKRGEWAPDMNRNFNEEDMQMPNEHIKTCSTLTISETQMKTSMKSYHTGTGMT